MRVFPFWNLAVILKRSQRLPQLILESIWSHLEWSFFRFDSFLSAGESFMEKSTSESTNIWSVASAPKGLLRPSQNITISNWIIATIKYENQLSVMSFPNVTSKTAEAIPNPNALNIIALIQFSFLANLAEDQNKINVFFAGFHISFLHAKENDHQSSVDFLNNKGKLIYVLTIWII